MEAQMKEKMISPLSDYVFSEIFGNQKNIDITKNFLKTLLDIPEDEYDKLTVVSPKLRKVFKTEKSGVVDLKLNTKSGKIIHIELQVEKRTNTRSRMLYYASRLIGDQLKLGDDYNKLHQSITIVICDHNLLEEESSYINIYELRNEENRSFTKLLRIIILELPKLPEKLDRTVWPWLKFLKCTEKEEFEMLAFKHPELEKPVFYAKKMSLWEEWKDIRFHRNLQKVDERNLHEQIKIDGRAEGLKEGIAQEKLVIAKNALAKGLSVEIIHDITGLDIETINSL
jgi:predicted transposase/invertase (TIGR01784 family)